jgi:hypothetical protein
MSVPLNLATSDYLRKTAERLRLAGHGGKGAIVAEAATFLNISNQELYRRLETVGYSTKRKARSDKGTSQVDAACAALIGGMIHVSTRANGKQILAITDALDLLKSQNLAPDVSAATIGRALRANHCHPAQLKVPSAHTNQRSLHPNHVWQVDASVCVLYYLGNGGLAVMERKNYYKNKPDNFTKISEQRVIRYVITDHFSGAIYLQYVHGSEDSANLTDCFLNCIQRRSNTDLMHGVPHILVMDKGSANMSGFFLNLLDRLSVRHIEHAAGNPRAKGQVEQAQNLVERKFESRLSFMKITDIDHLNREANKWRIAFNETAIHSRLSKSRNAVWQTIKAGELRIAPPAELCRELVTTKVTTATVKGDLTVNYTIKGYDNHSYDVRHVYGVYPKAKLEIVVNPYRAPDIDILGTDEQGNPMTYTVSPRQLDWVGFAHDTPVIGETMMSQPDSPADTSKKLLLKAAYGVDTSALVDAARKKKQAAYTGQIDPMADVKKVDVPEYLPRAGQQLQTAAKIRELAPLNLVVAAKRIKALVGDLWTAEHYTALKTTYPENVPAEAIEAIANAIRANNAPEAAPTKPLRVVGL